MSSITVKVTFPLLSHSYCLHKLKLYFQHETFSIFASNTPSLQQKKCCPFKVLIFHVNQPIPEQNIEMELSEVRVSCQERLVQGHRNQENLINSGQSRCLIQHAFWPKKSKYFGSEQQLLPKAGFIHLTFPLPFYEARNNCMK